MTFKSNAQLSVGGLLGGSSASVTGVNLKGFNPTSKMFLHGGALGNYAFNKKIGLQLELLYSGKGYNLEYTGDYQSFKAGQIKIQQKLNYLAIPLMFQYKMGDHKNYFHLDVGIVSNYLLGSKFNGDITIKQPNGDIETHILQAEFSPEKKDFSYALGVGLIANGISFAFRYEVGLNEIYIPETYSPKIFNRTFLVTVGYMIDLL